MFAILASIASVVGLILLSLYVVVIILVGDILKRYVHMRKARKWDK